MHDSRGKPPGTAKLKHVFVKDGVRIGVFGLAEKDWIGAYLCCVCVCMYVPLCLCVSVPVCCPPPTP